MTSRPWRGWGPVAVGLDHAVRATVLSRSRRSRRRSRAESLGPAERATALGALAERYRPGGALPDVEAFFPAAAAPDVRARQVRSIIASASATDLSWPSGYLPHADDVAERYLAYLENRTAVARLFRAGTAPRPTIVMLHGYLGGRHAVEQRCWPIGWMLHRGLDVALGVLPLHGARSAGGRPKFPSSDPRVNIEGFRQAVWDLRALMAHLLAAGSPAVGIMGMSLGGYTAALLACVEPRLAFSVPLVPLASIPSHAAEGDRFVGSEAERAEQYRLLDRVLSPVSPLHRPPLIAAERILVAGGRADRITGPEQARTLAEHLGARLLLFDGGHLLQLGRRQVFRELAAMLERLGLIAPRGSR